MLSAHIGLTYRCNMSCKHCYAKTMKNKTECADNINIQNAEIILDKLEKLGVVFLIYTYGENTLIKEFYDFLKLAKERNFIQTIMTNGWNIQTDNDILRLKECGITKVCISLDSLNAQTHDENRGKPGAWNHALNCIEVLNKNNMPFGIGCTISSANLNECDDFVDFALENKARFISFMLQRKNGVSDALNQTSKYLEQMKKLFLDKQHKGLQILTHDCSLLPLINTLKKQLTKESYEKLKDMNSCFAFETNLNIDPYGNMHGCSFIDQDIGNICMMDVVEIKERIQNSTCKRCWQ